MPKITNGVNTKRVSVNTRRPHADEIDDELELMKMAKPTKDAFGIKSISAGPHTLFIKDLPGKSDQIEASAEDLMSLVNIGFIDPTILQDQQESYLIDMPPQPPTKQYDLYLGDFDQFENSDVVAVNVMLQIIEQADQNDTCIIHISSNGGSIDLGLRFMYSIRTTFLRENIITIADPQCYSMGSHLFVIGGHRYIEEDSALMLHDYSTGMGGKGNQIKDYIEHTEKRFNQLTIDQYVTPGYMSPDELEHFKIGKEFWFTADMIIDRGIATHVILRDGNVMSVEDYKAFTNPEPIAEEKPKKKTATKKKVTPKATTKKVTKKKTEDK